MKRVQAAVFMAQRGRRCDSGVVGGATIRPFLSRKADVERVGVAVLADAGAGDADCGPAVVGIEILEWSIEPSAETAAARSSRTNARSPRRTRSAASPGGAIAIGRVLGGDAAELDDVGAPHSPAVRRCRRAAVKSGAGIGQTDLARGQSWGCHDDGPLDRPPKRQRHFQRICSRQRNLCLLLSAAGCASTGSGRATCVRRLWVLSS